MFNCTFFKSSNTKIAQRYNNYNENMFNNQKYQQGSNYGTATRYNRQHSSLTNKAPENQNIRQLRIDKEETSSKRNSEESNENNIIVESSDIGRNQTEPIEDNVFKI
jgi:hypothetical protein